MQESLCEKWFLQHFMDTDAMLPAIDAMDREIWKELPQPTLSRLIALASLSTSCALGLDLACSCPHHTISYFYRYRQSRAPDFGDNYGFFYSGGRKRWEAVIWLCTAPMLELCATPWGVTMVRWSAFLVCVTLRNTSRRLSISRA